MVNMNFIFAGSGTVVLKSSKPLNSSASCVLSDADIFMRGRTVGVRGWRTMAHQPNDPVFMSFELVPLHRHYLSGLERMAFRTYRFFRRQWDAFALRATGFAS